MTELSPDIERRPAVQVVTYRASEADLRPILWGIEEEQIPVEVTEATRGGAAELADGAAHASALNVGIAFDGAAGEVALSHRDLSGRAPLFMLLQSEFAPERLMRLGKNAARLVKGNPLEFGDAVTKAEAPPPRPKTAASDEAALIDRLASLILERLAKPGERT